MTKWIKLIMTVGLPTVRDTLIKIGKGFPKNWVTNPATLPQTPDQVLSTAV